MKANEILSTHPLLSDRVRLSIMASLAASKAMLDFTHLMSSLELTKGNLSAHLKKLEEAGLILVKKEFVDRKPRTTYECSKEGRKELEQYLRKVEEIIRSLGSAKK